MIPTVPRTKKEAYAELRKYVHWGSTIQISYPHTYARRDRMIHFQVENVNIDIYMSRICNLPLEEIPGKPGEYACRAVDTGEGAGHAMVGLIADRLFKNVFALNKQEYHS